MSVLGIVVAKKKSKRFPNKNIYNLNGIPLFWHGVSTMLESQMVDDIVVSTNSKTIERFCKKNNIKTIWRPENASLSDEPLINVLNFTYKSMDKRYDKILCILANSHGHTKEDISNAIEIFDKNNFNEIRSFDKNGVENGLLLFKENIILENKPISTYIGSIINNAKEIHYKNDLI